MLAFGLPGYYELLLIILVPVAVIGIVWYLLRGKRAK